MARAFVLALAFLVPASGAAELLPMTAPAALDPAGRPIVEQRVIPEVGVPTEVTPGQRFYSEMWLKKVQAFVIEQPFESRMPGAMGIRFSFAIDDLSLDYAGRSEDGQWRYFTAEPGKARAWHGLVGDVLAAGDTVGLRERADGRLEWFVDNSKHNGMTTIWSRPLKKGDPAVRRAVGDNVAPAGEPIRSLDYLGVRGNAVVIRYAETSVDSPPRAEEYLFPLDDEGRAVGFVMGAEFGIRTAPSQKAVTIVRKAMDGSFGTQLGAR